MSDEVVLSAADAPVAAAEPVVEPAPTYSHMTVFGQAVASADWTVAIGDGAKAEVPYAVSIAPIDWSKIDLSDEMVAAYRSGLKSQIHDHITLNSVSGPLATRALGALLYELADKKNEYDIQVRMKKLEEDAASAASAAASSASSL